jgi:cell division protein FtsL
MDEGIGKMVKAAGESSNREKTPADSITGRRMATESGSRENSPVDSSTGLKTAAAKGNRKKSGSGGTLKGLVSGTYIAEKLILNNMRYVILIAVLGIIFISNRFQAERVEREITKLEQEVRDLRAEALSASAQLGSVSRQSEVIDLVKERGLGLQELREPPYRIVVNE